MLVFMPNSYYILVNQRVSKTEKTLLNALNLLRESASVIQRHRNFITNHYAIYTYYYANYYYKTC